MGGTRYNVIDEVTGEVLGNVPAEQVATLPPGVRTANAQDERRVALQRKFGGLGGETAVGAYTLVQEGVPFGLGGAALEAALPGIGKFYREGQEVSSGIGETIGKGLGIGANIAMLGGPMGALDSAMARGGVSTIGRYAGIGAGEGALTGLGYGVSEAAATDTPLSGEKLVASALFGAGFGGAFGVGIGGTMSLIGKGAGQIQRALATAADAPGEEAAKQVLMKRFGHAPKGSVAWMSEKLADASAVLSGKPRDLTRKFLSLTPEGAEARKLATQAGPMKQGLVDDITRSVNTLETLNDNVSDTWRNAALKREQIAAKIRTDNIAEQTAAHQAQILQLKTTLDNLDKTGTGWGGGKELRKAVDDIESRIPWSTSNDLSTDMYHSLDRIRIELGKHAKSADRALSKSGTWKWQQRRDLLVDAYDNQLKPLLKDVELWGGAGAMQREVAEPLSDMMGALPRFRNAFLTEGTTKSVSNLWRNATVADRAKIERYIDTVTNPNADLNHQAMRQVLDGRVRSGKALLQYGDLNPAQRHAVSETQRESQKLLSLIDDSTDVVTAHNQLKELEGSTAEGMLTSSLLGGIVGGPAGGAAAIILSALKSPARTARQMAAVEHYVGQYGKKQQSAMAKALGRASVPMPKALTVVREGTKQAEAERRRQTKRQEYHEKRASLEEWDKNRDVSRYALQKQLAMVGKAAPQAVTGALDTYDRAGDHLLKHLPTSGAPADRVYGKVKQPSSSETASWLRRVRAIEDPTTLFADIAKGKLSREAVDAVRDVYPGIYSEMRRDVLETIADLESKGEHVPWKQRLQLSTLLDMPTDGTLEPHFVQYMQDMYAEEALKREEAQRQGESSGGGKQQSFSELFQTDSAKTEQQGAA